MHWVKVPNMEYRFAKFNKHVKILKYSDLVMMIIRRASTIVVSFRVSAVFVGV